MVQPVASLFGGPAGPAATSCRLALKSRLVWVHLRGQQHLPCRVIVVVMRTGKGAGGDGIVSLLPVFFCIVFLLFFFFFLGWGAPPPLPWFVLAGVKSAGSAMWAVRIGIEPLIGG